MLTLLLNILCSVLLYFSMVYGWVPAPLQTVNRMFYPEYAPISFAAIMMVGCIVGTINLMLWGSVRMGWLSGVGRRPRTDYRKCVTQMLVSDPNEKTGVSPVYGEASVPTERDCYREYKTAADARRDAERGQAHAQHQYGIFMLRAEKYLEARHWLTKSAGQNYLLAKYELGMTYHPNQGEAWADINCCLSHLSDVATRHQESIEELSHHMASNVSYVVNDTIAIRQANKSLALLYFAGKYVAKDVYQALTYIRAANDKHSDGSWLYTHGMIAMALINDGEQYVSEARNAFEKAAKRGVSRGAFEAGKLYLLNKTEYDPEKARYWLNIAASHGLAQAHYYLGCLYGRQFNNVPAAKTYFIEAAKLGVSDAMKRLALFHIGKSGDGNVMEGIKWAILCERCHHKDSAALMAYKRMISREQFTQASEEAERFYVHHLMGSGQAGTGV